ncbi:MAG: hypothetical protein PUF20_04055, partial [Clostridiales bacterium]|nr:hypothetical protein [Clostridiales bacterium]
MNGSWMIEQQGKSEGGKEPPSRSITSFSNFEKVRKTASAWRKDFFDTLKRPAPSGRFFYVRYGKERRFIVNYTQSALHGHRMQRRDVGCFGSLCVH